MSFDLLPSEQRDIRPAPDDLVKRAEILFCNSLYGYQCPGRGIEKDIFAICWCGDLSDEEVELIKDISGSETVKHDDYIGHDYITIKWYEHNKIPDIFNAMLQLGLWFTSNNRASVTFRSSETKIFSNELMEKKFIQQTKELLRLIPNAINDDHYIKNTYLDIWNYITEEGKAFCRYLRQVKHFPDPINDDAFNYFNWAIFQNYDPNTLLTTVGPNNIAAPNVNIGGENIGGENIGGKNVGGENIGGENVGGENVGGENIGEENVGEENDQSDSDDDSLCIICMLKEANTMVLPCECVVVCKDCSIALQNTNDRHTCVKCRRPITNILD